MNRNTHALRTRIDSMLATLDKQLPSKRVNQCILYELPIVNGRPDSHASEQERDAYNLQHGLDIQARIAEIRASGLVPFLLPFKDDDSGDLSA